MERNFEQSQFRIIEEFEPIASLDFCEAVRSKHNPESDISPEVCGCHICITDIRISEAIKLRKQPLSSCCEVNRLFLPMVRTSLGLEGDDILTAEEQMAFYATLGQDSTFRAVFLTAIDAEKNPPDPIEPSPGFHERMVKAVEQALCEEQFRYSPN